MRLEAPRLGWLVLAICLVGTLAAAGVAPSRGSADGGGGGGAGAGLFGGGQTVALVKLDGSITDAMVAPISAGRQYVLAELRRAERDASVKAVVLRIDSRGAPRTAKSVIQGTPRLSLLSGGGVRGIMYERCCGLGSASSPAKSASRPSTSAAEGAATCPLDCSSRSPDPSA